MKKLSFIYILFCASIIANAQLQHENFNASSMPDGWSATQTDGGHSWEFGYSGNLKGSGIQNPASFQSGGVVFKDYASGDFNHNIVTLSSPAIDLKTKYIVEASIELTYNLRTFANDGNFKVNVWDGDIWQNVLTVSEDTNSKNSGESTTSTIDVTDYINSEFKVQFIYDDENSLTWGVGIDDYKLTGVVGSGVDSFESIGFQYYPNPVVDGELTLVSSQEISNITVYNTLGQKIMSNRPTILETKLNMQNFASGTYIVQVTIGDKIGNIKIIKD